MVLGEIGYLFDGGHWFVLSPSYSLESIFYLAEKYFVSACNLYFFLFFTKVTMLNLNYVMIYQSLFYNLILCALQITGQSCPLSFKGSPYWMAPEVRLIKIFILIFFTTCCLMDYLIFTSVAFPGYKELKWSQPCCGYMESWVHGFGNGYNKTTLESV